MANTDVDLGPIPDAGRRTPDPVLVLGIETSCDETGVAIVRDGRDVKANLIASQVDLHARYGGVVPEVASRQHLAVINPLLDMALAEAGVTWSDLGAVAVTRGPGLQGALLVGVMAAKTIAWTRKLPLVGVNHLEGHIYANFLAFPDLRFPFLCLVVSGGHTMLVRMDAHGEYRLLGETRDDAAGEAFDKVGRILGLPYPGGPAIDEAAGTGNPDAFPFPIARLDGRYDFSYSGLKTAVWRKVEHMRAAGQELPTADLAASFQQAAVELLVAKTLRAAEDFDLPTIVVAGGVSANRLLRTLLAKRGERDGFRVHFPSPDFCTDNAAMIACAGYFQLQRGHVAPLSLSVRPRFPVGATD